MEVFIDLLFLANVFESTIEPFKIVMYEHLELSIEADV